MRASALLPASLLLAACSAPRLTTPLGRVETEINGGSDHGIEMDGAVYGQGRLWLSVQRTGLWSLDLESGQLVACEESIGPRQARFRLPVRTPQGRIISHGWRAIPDSEKGQRVLWEFRDGSWSVLHAFSDAERDSLRHCGATLARGETIAEVCQDRILLIEPDGKLHEQPFHGWPEMPFAEPMAYVKQSIFFGAFTTENSSGGLFRYDLGTDTLTAMAHIPVDAMVPDPSHPDCMLVSFASGSAFHDIQSYGGVARVCGDSQEFVLREGFGSTREELNSSRGDRSRWGDERLPPLGVPQEAVQQAREPGPVHDLIPFLGGFWAASEGDDLPFVIGKPVTPSHHLRWVAGGLVTRVPLPKFRPLAGLSISTEVPGLIGIEWVKVTNWPTIHRIFVAR